MVGAWCSGARRPTNSHRARKSTGWVEFAAFGPKSRRVGHDRAPRAYGDKTRTRTRRTRTVKRSPPLLPSSRHGGRPLFRRALGSRDLRADVFSAPVRSAQDVHDEPGLGAILPPRHLHRAGLVVPRPAGLRDHASHAPRVQRHGEGSALAPQLPGLVGAASHGVGDEVRVRGGGLRRRGARGSVRW